jgi:hypothetical protein
MLAAIIGFVVVSGYLHGRQLEKEADRDIAEQCLK